MSDVIYRIGTEADLPALIGLWHEVFGDDEAFISDFLHVFYAPDRVSIAELDGKIVSAVYTLPTAGIHLPDGSVYPTLMAYALATTPAVRGRGIGAETIDQAAENAYRLQSDYFVLCPAEDSLFPFYTNRLGYRDQFSVREFIADISSLPAPSGTLSSADPTEYNAFRDSFLSREFYLKLDSSAAAYLKQLCKESGGDLFLIHGTDYSACAACECCDGSVYVKELLCPDRRLPDAVSLLCSTLNTMQLTIRTPVFLGSEQGGTVRRFGQVVSKHTADPLPLDPGYYGPAFD